MLPPEVPDPKLVRLDALGVRRVRFNLTLGGPLRAGDLVPMARRPAPLGWHCQLDMVPGDLVEATGLLRRLPCPLVLDHLGQVPQPDGLRSAAFAAVRRRLDAGNTWVKLSGPCITSRVGPPGYADPGEVAAALLDLLGRWIRDAAARRRALVDNPAQL